MDDRKELEPYEFHDYALLGINITPAQGEEGDNNITVMFVDKHDKVKKRVIFKSCANISLNLDFDILAESWPYNTGSSGSTNEPDKIEHLVKKSEIYWNVEDIENPNAPMTRKLESVKGKSAYQIGFFGGLLLVIAESANIESENQS